MSTASAGTSVLNWARIVSAVEKIRTQKRLRQGSCPDRAQWARQGVADE